MIALKLITLLVTLHLSQSAVNWPECAQKAIRLGVDSLGIPSHDPLHIPHNFSGSIPLGSHNITFLVSNLVWTNLPFWNITKAKQITNDDKYSVYEYDLYWKQFVVSSNFDVAYGNNDYKGTATLTLDEIDWTGRYNITKSVNGSNQYLNELVVKQTYEKATVKVTNISSFIESFAEHLLLGIFTGLSAVGNQADIFGTLFQYAINNRWFNNATRLTVLQEWCAAN